MPSSPTAPSHDFLLSTFFHGPAAHDLELQDYPSPGISTYRPSCAAAPVTGGGCCVTGFASTASWTPYYVYGELVRRAAAETLLAYNYLLPTQQPPSSCTAMARREDYDNSQVAAAANPPACGYYHGPIPDPNHGWVPASHHRLDPAIIAAENGAISTLAAAARTRDYAAGLARDRDSGSGVAV
ncbi:hypothetical protein DL766_005697 [Monosporascus sp. MC13-8B]|uniref:Uncharacterized protein n=1 Tax=Monosporascus cannonballus TaxID=155416 RepID=A0ABY0HL74_9PEZI|nr:hypothetical protein DL762_001289 [Monosporascus cannonballus]RYO99723.1 hypothetical protein DL763_001331 [Monosporascus cannonballus]RYP28783.1 hypothetical protein DL766_005697 [Monosporascus sp. MC13-8B]